MTEPLKHAYLAREAAQFARCRKDAIYDAINEGRLYGTFLDGKWVIPGLALLLYTQGKSLEEQRAGLDELNSAALFGHHATKVLEEVKNMLRDLHAHQFEAVPAALKGSRGNKAA